MASYGRPRRHKSILNDDDDDDDDDGDDEQDMFPQQFTRNRRDKSVLSEKDPINTGKDEDDDINNNDINEDISNDEPVWEREHTRSRRDRSVLYENDDLSKTSPDEIKTKKEEEEEEEEEAEEEDINVEETLMAENRDIVFSGFLERKTNQKVLGKHLWETRYFKLSTHSLSVYINNKTNITESIIKLSTIISINRNNRLIDGSDLKNNRFDINLKNNRIINLRTENSTLCQQWIHFISQQRKKHRQSIRTGLDKIAENDTTFEKAFEKETKKTIVRRFKRQRTSRSNNDQKNHQKVNIIDDDDDDDYNDEDPEIIDTNDTITKPIEFEGFLIRKIGHNTDKIGEKLYFRLSNDSLEFSKIDEELNDNKQDLQRKHSTNILGSISIEHIKSVKINLNNNKQFTIVFNEHNSNSDWILSESNNNGQKWVNILLKAQTNAKFIGKTINNINNGENDINYTNNNNNSDTENSDTESDSDSNQFNRKRKKKRKKKLGGHIKALQKMINEETIQELEIARNQELDNKSLVNGFEISSLDNTVDVNIPNTGFCSCLCFK